MKIEKIINVSEFSPAPTSRKAWLSETVEEARPAVRGRPHPRADGDNFALELSSMGLMFPGHYVNITSKSLDL